MKCKQEKTMFKLKKIQFKINKELAKKKKLFKTPKGDSYQDLLFLYI